MQQIRHKHEQILREVPREDGVEGVCYACEEPALGLTNICCECNFILHKACADLRLEIQHAMHPRHFLHLFQQPPYTESCWCDICQKKLQRFTYSCEICVFDACITCALQCKFRHDSHDHPLIPTEVQGRDDEVAVCYRYFAHVKCATSVVTNFLRSEQGQFKVEEDVNLTMIRLPVSDASVNLISYFTKGINLGETEKGEVLNYISHDHPLILREMQAIVEDIAMDSATNASPVTSDLTPYVPS
ncbi:hypothetical protein RJ639_016762 [Escallonia herrerae]|uniref:DC1 domain-containing protein n=1 Tax=Escallonia herrerae TaxID=1293975 RepID=A0AA88VDE2_9ASTE|nr:hypothetical protein RJ639_016762 [Escallonia herrerae]